MSSPMMVEVIAYAPTAFYHCTHCEVAFREMGKSDTVQKEQLSSSLPPDLLDDYLAVSDWVRSMFRLHSENVIIKVIDAASVEGVLASLRHRTRRFPAVIVGKHGRYVGKDSLQRAAEEIARRLEDRRGEPTAA